MEIELLGATREVTGSCLLLRAGERRVLIDCGLIQGSSEQEERNRSPFPFDVETLDAMVLSHAHLDHSGRIPLLVKRGYRGPVYCQHATRDLCQIMLQDAAFLNEKEAEWTNRKRERKGLDPVEPLYDRRQAGAALDRFEGVDYDRRVEIVPGVEIRFRDAGHILGSTIVEVWASEGGHTRKLVFSGDLGHRDAPILRDYTLVEDADLVLMESTYGDRRHRSWEETRAELGEIFNSASYRRGNILIPSFAVGRAQDLLYLMAKHYEEWHLDHWEIYLDSPMAIEATRVYAHHHELYDPEARAMWHANSETPLLPNLHMSQDTEESMALNRRESGAIIIAGSGMCTGGRIKHHLKHHAWKRNTHVMIVGFQARGTPGRALVDGADTLRLWGEEVRIAAHVHTIGGLSAHADQEGLEQWYAGFGGHPPVVLLHGEPDAMESLAGCLRKRHKAPVMIGTYGAVIDLDRPDRFK